MSETAQKQNPVRTFVAGVRKHERKILATALTISVVGNVVMRSGISQHNAFLKEHGLYEQFYNLTSPEA